MENHSKNWHLIVENTPFEGSWNMAVDDYLFRSLNEYPQTFVRFYRWKKPTVSLGYSQKIFRVVDIDYCHHHGVDIVRRMTGGKLVLHHKEITYSVCSSDRERFTDTLKGSYKIISRALMEGLKKMALDPCLADAPPLSYVRGNMPCFSFPARDEIEVKGKKIIGSAQKRVGVKFLQHGSIPLEKEEELLRAVSFLEEKEDVVRSISLSEALGRKITFEWAVKHFIQGIEEYFGLKLKPKVFSKKEKEIILKIQAERYANPDWTYSRGKQRFRN